MTIRAVEWLEHMTVVRRFHEHAIDMPRDDFRSAGDIDSPERGRKEGDVFGGDTDLNASEEEQDTSPGQRKRRKRLQKGASFKSYLLQY